ncbi:hypothetical protein TIFTF001_021860 [Ficus carica]|uniref:Uncharacterized protein n=1 Tax=Ficus carica TaxID=3494 RepID=A0AA88AHK7_FICCA|nr:hypothetical protein TIFTF001_021860 [Ficus carica]
MMRNSTIQVAFSGPSPIVIGRQTRSAAQTHSSINLYSGVWMGAEIGSSIFSLVKKLVGFIVSEESFYEGVIEAILDLHDDLIKAVQVIISVHGAIIRGYGRHFKTSWVELLQEVIQFVLVFRLDFWWGVETNSSRSARVADRVTYYGDSSSAHDSDYTLQDIVSLFSGSPAYTSCSCARLLGLGFSTSQLICVVQPVKSLQLLPPIEDLHLCGFSQCSRAMYAFGSPSALRTSRDSPSPGCPVACKREEPRSKGDTCGVSSKGTSMLKSVFPLGLGPRVTMMGRILSGLGGGGWCRSRDKDMYNDRYRTLGVRWCGVMGVACLATVRLSVSTGQCGKSSIGRPLRNRLSCGQGSVARASTLEPDSDLPEVPKRELIRGSVAQRRCGQIFSIGWAKKPTGSRAPRYPMDRLSLAP